MKSTSDIIARAVILFCLYERCKVELSFHKDKDYVKNECENQRASIYRWIKEKEYESFLTTEERDFFMAPIGVFESQKVNLLSHQYESIRPLLWSVGLMNELLSYEGFDSDSYGEKLQIDSKHSRENVEALCFGRTQDEIALQTEVAMLWHWRSMEMGKVPKGGRSWGDCIKRIFGDEYAEVLDQIPQDTKIPHDFLIGDKPVCELNETEQRIYSIVAYWRHHAFEWIMSDDAWDDVSADT